MLTKLKYFLLSLLVVISVSELIPSKHIDKEIQPYYDLYMKIVNTYCTPKQYWFPRKVKVQFGNLLDKDSEVIGVCAYAYPRRFVITLDKQFFEFVPEVQKFQVLAHEMRHCLFLADHSQDPGNYMAPYFPILPAEVLIKQVTEDIKNSCKQN